MFLNACKNNFPIFFSTFSFDKICIINFLDQKHNLHSTVFYIDCMGAELAKKYACKSLSRSSMFFVTYKQCICNIGDDFYPNNLMICLLSVVPIFVCSNQMDHLSASNAVKLICPCYLNKCNIMRIIATFMKIYLTKFCTFTEIVL